VLFALSADEHCANAQASHDDLAAEGARHQVVQRRAVFGTDDADNFSDGLAASVGEGQSGERLGALAEAGHLTCAADGDQRVPHRVEQSFDGVVCAGVHSP